MRNTTDLSNSLDEKQKEKQSNDEIVAGLEQEILTLRYEVDKLRVKIREKEMGLIKAKFNSRKNDGELKILTRAFWNSKNEGL